MGVGQEWGIKGPRHVGQFMSILAFNIYLSIRFFRPSHYQISWNHCIHLFVTIDGTGNLVLIHNQ